MGRFQWRLRQRDDMSATLRDDDEHRVARDGAVNRLDSGVDGSMTVLFRLLTNKER